MPKTTKGKENTSSSIKTNPSNPLNIWHEVSIICYKQKEAIKIILTNHNTGITTQPIEYQHFTPLESELISLKLYCPLSWKKAKNSAP